MNIQVFASAKVSAGGQPVGQLSASRPLTIYVFSVPAEILRLYIIQKEN